MAARLQPIDNDGTAHKAFLGSTYLGVVKLERHGGLAVWVATRRDGERGFGIFESAEHAADQLAVDHTMRRARKKKNR